jgi:hypothetical protein
MSQGKNSILTGPTRLMRRPCPSVRVLLRQDVEKLPDIQNEKHDEKQKNI